MNYNRRQLKPETVWLRYVRQRLQLSFGSKCRLIKIMGGLGQEAGISDLIGVIDGFAVALELKTPGGRHKVSPAQAQFLEDWNMAAGIGVVIDSQQTLDDFIGKFQTVQGRLFR